jgi:hypothetical protein
MTATHVYIHLPADKPRKKTGDAGNFNESDHPRDKDGKFGSGSGGGSSKSESKGGGKSEGKSSTSKPPRMKVSALKQGTALYDKQGRKVDEVEAVSKHGLGGYKLETRAGYSIRLSKEGDIMSGGHWLSTEKP